MVGVFGRESKTNTSAEVFRTECHFAGIKLIIPTRKNLCSGFTNGLIPYGKELFDVMKSPILTKTKFIMSLLSLIFCRNREIGYSR